MHAAPVKAPATKHLIPRTADRSAVGKFFTRLLGRLLKRKRRAAPITPSTNFAVRPGAFPVPGLSNTTCFGKAARSHSMAKSPLPSAPRFNPRGTGKKSLKENIRQSVKTPQKQEPLTSADVTAKAPKGGSLTKPSEGDRGPKGVARSTCENRDAPTVSKTPIGLTKSIPARTAPESKPAERLGPGPHSEQQPPKAKPDNLPKSNPTGPARVSHARADNSHMSSAARAPRPGFRVPTTYKNSATARRLTSDRRPGAARDTPLPLQTGSISRAIVSAPGAAPGRGPAAAADGGGAGLVEQTLSRITHSLRSGRDTVVFEVAPPSLGRVKVRMSSDNGQVRLELRCSHPLTFQQLRQELGTLEQRLDDAGVNHSGVNLSQGDESDGESGGAGREALLPDSGEEPLSIPKGSDQTGRIVTSALDLVA